MIAVYKYIKSTEDISDGIILYRSGSIAPDIILNSDRGVFFTSDASYFDNHPKMQFDEDFQKYLLLPTARVWDPSAEFDMFEIDGYDKICCLISDLDKFGIDDECDWELDEKLGVTSSDGLAIAGKKLGYDATVIRNIWYHHGTFDEYAVYNPSVIRTLD